MKSELPQCGLHVALAVMGGKWKPLILYYLNPGPKRFGDLKRLVPGISEKVLIQQLRELAAAGVVSRHDYQRVPPMVDYTITAFGMTLVRALMPLCEWGTENRDRVSEVRFSHPPGPGACTSQSANFGDSTNIVKSDDRPDRTPVALEVAEAEDDR